MLSKRPYLPPFAVVLGLLGLGGESLPIAGDQPVTVPFGILRLLLRGALAAVPFHEERYLHLNPDVAAAVFRGEIRSGHEHFITNGYFEGRQGASDEFAESWYLETNTDVALAVRAGTFTSAYEHYIVAGMFELRGPNPVANDELAVWRTCCKAAPGRAAAIADNSLAVTQDQ